MFNSIKNAIKNGGNSKFGSLVKMLITKLQMFLQTKRGVSTLVFLGAAILLSSFWFPYWNLDLRAPQYPDGLKIQIYMDHVEGDVSEVNILNHYIGMGSLDDAAKFERQIAWYVLVLLTLGAVLVIPIGRKVYKIFYLPPVIFLLGFVGDLFYWLYQAGHDLNPDAPVRITPFTPAILGVGEIGQFKTIAFFSTGFWMAVLGTIVIFYALGKKKALCQGCADFKNCKMVCQRPASWLTEKLAEKKT